MGPSEVVTLLGWLGQLWLLSALIQAHLPRPERWLLLGFLLAVDLRYLMPNPDVWAGLAALTGIFCVRQYLVGIYRGQFRRSWLVVCALAGIVALTLLPSVGLALIIGLGLFSLLHCFLHEREEKGISYHQVSNREVWNRWLTGWGVYWALPTLIALSVLLGFGMTGHFSGVTIGGLGHRSVGFPTVGFGYFSSFHTEFEAAVQPWQEATRHGHWLSISMQIVTLVLIGLLPIAGILGVGYQLPNRFIYRLLQREDEELLLAWICGTTLILGTLAHSDSLRLTGIGALTFFAGWLAVYRWGSRRAHWERWFQSLAAVLVLLMLAGLLV